MYVCIICMYYVCTYVCMYVVGPMYVHTHVHMYGLYACTCVNSIHMEEEAVPVRMS